MWWERWLPAALNTHWSPLLTPPLGHLRLPASTEACTNNTAMSWQQKHMLSRPRFHFYPSVSFCLTQINRGRKLKYAASERNFLLFSAPSCWRRRMRIIYCNTRDLSLSRCPFTKCVFSSESKPSGSCSPRVWNSTQLLRTGARTALWWSQILDWFILKGKPPHLRPEVNETRADGLTERSPGAAGSQG